MAESTSAAVTAAPIPDSADITRAEAFAREGFLLEGEDPASALAPGTPRRRALDAALHELAGGAKYPSPEWRRNYSLLLGLERVLSDDEPKLADGTVLSAHQVDALSGTLVALMAEAQRTNGANGQAALAAAPDRLASAEILGPGLDAESESANGARVAHDATKEQAEPEIPDDEAPEDHWDEDEDEEDGSEAQEDEDFAPAPADEDDEDDVDADEGDEEEEGDEVEAQED